MSYLKRYFIWTLAYMAAIIALFWGTDLHLNWWQTFLFLAAITTYGASKSSHARWDMERRVGK